MKPIKTETPSLMTQPELEKVGREKKVREGKAAAAGTCVASLTFPQPTSDFSHSSTLPALIALCLKHVTGIFSLFAHELL